MRTAALLVVLALAGCNEDTLELDGTYAGAAELCQGFVCDATPRCSDGGSDCAVCLCCACSEGETRCDPEQSSGRWTCASGCFVDTPCELDEACVAHDGAAACVPSDFDCTRPELLGQPEVCGETEELCAACGTCVDCAATGGDDLCGGGGWGGGGGGGGALLLCSGASGCMQRVGCALGARCVLGVETGVAECSDELDCAALGCTGYPVCGAGESACGPCGCCALAGAPASRCGPTTGGGGSSRFFLDTVGKCYREDPCTMHEVCVYDSFGQPTCTAGGHGGH